MRSGAHTDSVLVRDLGLRTPSHVRTPGSRNCKANLKTLRARAHPLSARSRPLHLHPPHDRSSTPARLSSGRARPGVGTNGSCTVGGQVMLIASSTVGAQVTRGIRTGPSIDPVIIFARSTPHSRHLRRPSRHVAPSRISANGVVLHCEIIAHYTFPCPAHWARSRRSASRAPRSSRRPRTRHVPRSRTRDETRTASTYRCEPPRSSTKCAPQRANGGA